MLYPVAEDHRKYFRSRSEKCESGDQCRAPLEMASGDSLDGSQVTVWSLELSSHLCRHFIENFDFPHSLEGLTHCRRL